MKDPSQITDSRKPFAYRCYHCGEKFEPGTGFLRHSDNTGFCPSCTTLMGDMNRLEKLWKKSWVIWPKGYELEVDL